MVAAERLQDCGYFGPLGVDAMRYRLPDGSVHLRPLQDINARWALYEQLAGARQSAAAAAERPDGNGANKSASPKEVDK